MELRSLSSCTCSGYVTSYECLVVGDGFTVWNGSALNCSLTKNEIILQHREFNSGTVKTCNSGRIVGRSSSVTNECYTSRLDVNISTELEGREVKCWYENTSATTKIGSSVISLMRGTTIYTLATMLLITIVVC